ncbi:MAG: hypothetical protein FJ148_28490 [Deltaproteobacteria bacterium]|nr:hypothetical protein [Deltaproteobacteria bacterium]
MISTISIALSAAPATAAIATTGLEPLLWVTVGLMAAAAALIVREAWPQPSVPTGLSPDGAKPRARSRAVPKQPRPLLDAA